MEVKQPSPPWIESLSITFFRNKYGKSLALYEGYTYYSSDRCDYAKMWRCTKGYPCKARFKATFTGEVIRVTTFQHTHPPPSMIIRNGVLLKVPKDKLLYLYNQAGKPTALLYGYSYYYNGNRKKTDVWRCTKTAKCCASFVTTKDRKILRWNIAHTHPPVDYTICDAYFVRNINGKELAIVGGQSFYCGSRGAKTAIWRCTRWGQCRARFIMNVQGEMVTSHLEHNHKPPIDVCPEPAREAGGYIKWLYLLQLVPQQAGAILALYSRLSCKARLSTTPEYKIIRGFVKHIHEPPRFVIHEGIIHKL
ncbi:modifier of mdg4 [Danaus plexippus plexippus]|uniref:Modifier of mdg4 n=1 Tax=Danaus plexippus plexippus TaxID=278856 RepID=A0A212ESK8_DANPL|nr:modifier of mdg4 [Danaus plexippus plexippus]